MWGMADAQVICHQLGYSKATSIDTGLASGHDRGYLLSKVNCSGSEISLSECDRVYGVHDCSETYQYAEAQCTRGKVCCLCSVSVNLYSLCNINRLAIWTLAFR